MDKAWVRIVDCSKNDGTWAMYVDVRLCLAQQVLTRVAVPTSPDSFHPAGGWKQLIATAVGAACSDAGFPIDEVLFDDLTTETP